MTDLVRQLRRQLRFIENSCQAFDAGSPDEALRIAVSLRVLFHDTANSTSLLSHMGKKDSVGLLSTIGSGRTKEDLAGKILIMIPVMLTMEGVRPPLGRTKRRKVIPCDSWWNEVVMAQTERFSRRDVVVSAANQDGGAHVDIAPNSLTTELREGIGTFTRRAGHRETTERLTDHHLPLLRQFGYEVLNSPDLARFTEDPEGGDV